MFGDKNFDCLDLAYQVILLYWSCFLNVVPLIFEKLGIEKSKIPELSKFNSYGLGYAIGYDFDYAEYHSFVHGRLPYENLKPDPVLRSLLLSLPYRKVVFKNAEKIHAAKCLNRLGLEGFFEGILCFETLNHTHNININSDGEDEQNTDTRNIAFGKCVGLTTVLAKRGADFTIAKNVLTVDINIVVSCLL
ncbi:hypothetical protein MKX03_007437 [Papaver bracteatum]|nr:hypothetical protein MKX03_007437 [Papaver bracteatum]